MRCLRFASRGFSRTAVEHYQGCKGTEEVERLERLEDRIDEIVNTKQWTRR